MRCPNCAKQRTRTHSLQSVAVDPTGASYVVGETFGTLPGQSPAGTLDAFIRKYDPSGAESWTRQFGAWERDIAWAGGAEAGDHLVEALSHRLSCKGAHRPGASSLSRRRWTCWWARRSRAARAKKPKS